MTKRKPPPAGPEHTDDCVYARGGPDQWPTIWDLAHRAAADGGSLAAALNVAFVRAIDECPHRAHEAYRLMYRRGPLPAPAQAGPTGDRVELAGAGARVAP